jgi:hypothetical protein
LFGSWQHTETHRVPLTTTVAVLVSVVPVPLSVPGAAPPSFWATPNQGSAPIMNAALAGIATMVAVLPGATDAVTVAPVDAVPPLIVTEHQLKKFITVSVTSLLLDPPLELLLPVAVSADASDGVVIGGEGLLHATAPARANATVPATPSQFIRFIVLIVKPPRNGRCARR